MREVDHVAGALDQHELSVAVQLLEQALAVRDGDRRVERAGQDQRRQRAQAGHRVGAAVVQHRRRKRQEHGQRRGAEVLDRRIDVARVGV